jgi:hypothetical protein
MQEREFKPHDHPDVTVPPPKVTAWPLGDYDCSTAVQWLQEQRKRDGRNQGRAIFDGNSSLCRICVRASFRVGNRSMQIFDANHFNWQHSFQESDLDVSYYLLLGLVGKYPSVRLRCCSSFWPDSARSSQLAPRRAAQNLITCQNLRAFHRPLQIQHSTLPFTQIPPPTDLIIHHRHPKSETSIPVMQFALFRSTHGTRPANPPR